MKAATSPEKSDDLEIAKSPKSEEKVLSPKKEKASPKKKSPSPKKDSPEKIKESPKTEEKPKKVNPFAAMMGKSPSLNDSTSNSKIQEYEEIVKKSKYDPIDDAIWKQGQKTPYLAFAKTLQAIEATSGRLKTIEILSNYFRSVMVLSPDDLLPSVYLCLNRLAPAYEGIELGIGTSQKMH